MVKKNKFLANKHSITGISNNLMGTSFLSKRLNTALQNLNKQTFETKYICFLMGILYQLDTFFHNQDDQREHGILVNFIDQK
jgi:hypothetical protein